MRCPYCGGLNNDQARFCAACGRDMVPPKPGAQPAAGQRYQPQGQQAQRQPAPPSYTQPSSYTQPRPPAQPTRTASPAQPARTAPSAQPARTAAPPARSAAPVAPAPSAAPVPRPPVSAPEAPAPFPPRTIEQLKALTQGALAFTVADEGIVNGRKKVVSIVYQRCVPWQQVATLLKALEQYQEETKFETIIVQGVSGANAIESGYTNGQLRYDRNVPLGSQKINRYQIETDGNMDANSIRIVLSSGG